MGSFVPATQDELQSMLTEMGYTSIRELYANCLLYTSDAADD